MGAGAPFAAPVEGGGGAEARPDIVDAAHPIQAISNGTDQLGTHVLVQREVDHLELIDGMIGNLS